MRSESHFVEDDSSGHRMLMKRPKSLRSNLRKCWRMKIVIYANVILDTKDRVQFPYGIAEFRSFILRHFILADQPYRHDNAKAVEGDIIIWAFKDEEGLWYLIGDGFVKDKVKSASAWEFWIEGARLYPRSVPLDELSLAETAKKALYVGYVVEWKDYRKIIEKAIEPLV